MDIWKLQILRFVTLYVLLIGCEKLYPLEAAQAHNTAPVPNRAQSASSNSSEISPIVPQVRSGGYINRNTPLKSKFWVAIKGGDIVTLRNLIDDKTNFNFIQSTPSDMQGQKALETTPLLQAVAGGHPEMVEFLIQQGAEVNFHPSETGSALHWAAWSGNIKVVRVLLRHGALVDERNYYGETPLILAATNSADTSVVKELIAAGANIHAQSTVGVNPVMGAAWQHHLDSVKLLVSLGVDACAKNNKGETAIDQARTNLNEDPGKHEVIAFLQEKCGHQ